MLEIMKLDCFSEELGQFFGLFEGDLPRKILECGNCLNNDQICRKFKYIIGVVAKYHFYQIFIPQSIQNCQYMSFPQKSNDQSEKPPPQAPNIPNSQTSHEGQWNCPPNPAISSTVGSSTLQKINLKSRSLKTKNQNLEISFEAGFLQQHQHVFREALKNLLESALKKIPDLNYNQILSAVFKKATPKQEYSFLQTKLLSPAKIQQIQFDLKNEQKLSSFIGFVKGEIPQQLSDQMTILAYLCWEKYIQIRSPLLEAAQLLEIGADYAEIIYQKIRKGQEFRYLTFRDVQKEMVEEPEVFEESLREFVKVFVVTVFFVVQQYFQNPLKEREGDLEQQPHSQFNNYSQMFDSEPEPENAPQKKFKYN